MAGAAATEAPPANGNGGAPTEQKRTVEPVDTFKEAMPLLRRPFTTQAVKFKVQATFPKGEPQTALCVTYIDARLVIERLNMVVCDKWAPRFDGNWCHLSLFELPARSDVGEGTGKGLVSDSLKRAAVHWGIGVSLYATPKMFLKVSDGHVKQAQSKDGPTLRLTPQGEARCRELYDGWLKMSGVGAFGEALDHGDVDDAQGDAEVDEGGEAPGGAPEAEAVRSEQDQVATAPQTEPTPAADAAPATDPEAALEELLAKKSTLTDLRVQANDGMKRLGALPDRRLRELEGAGSTKGLEALIARVNNAMDGGGASE